MEVPIYGLTEAAQYLRVPLATLRYWVHGGGPVSPLIRLAGSDPSRLSFMNLLECYMLSSMRAIYDVRNPKVRKSLATLAKYVQHKHPLVEQAFQTDRRDLFIEHVGKVVNLSKDEQILIPGVMELYLERIERDPKGLFKLYPFVMERTSNEPRLILINPAVGFGKPVIAGTGIFDRSRLLQVQRSGICARPSFRIWRLATTDRRSDPVGAADGSRRCLKTSFFISTKIFTTANPSSTL